MLAEMPRMLRCSHMSQEALLAGNWREAVEALLAQEETAGAARASTAAPVTAAAILENWRPPTG